MVASLLVITGVFAERTYLLLPSLMRGGPLDMVSSYSPTSTEWTLMAAAYSLGLLLFLLAGRMIFPQQTVERHTASTTARTEGKWGFQRG